jgi:GH35 family endo-1,4-beta-xylanase
MGQQVQTFEIAGVEIRHYGPGVQAGDTGLDLRYEGAAEDASWRAAAAERIERIRKADLRVRVVDAEGRPVEGAKILARMTKHEFCFGTAIAAEQLLGTSADSDRYRRAFLDLFNCAVFENDLKWPSWERNRQRALDGLRWMRDHGIARVRGHNLVWPSWRYLPADLPGLAVTPDALRKRINDHIVEIVNVTRGWVTEWDVINEPYNNRDLQSVLGDEEMARWFQTARREDPYASMYMNDYSILSAGGGDFLHRNHYFNTISFLREKGAVVDGIGMQGHFSAPTPPELMLSILDRFSVFGVPITITEFDYNSKDAALQAQFTRDLMTVLFSHPAVDGFLMWGFWEGRHWLPDGAMIRRDWSTKPNYDVYRQLVFSDWRTAAEGESDAEGAWTVRGFRGEYEIEAFHGDRKQTVSAALPAAGAEIVVKLP